MVENFIQGDVWQLNGCWGNLEQYNPKTSLSTLTVVKLSIVTCHAMQTWRCLNIAAGNEMQIQNDLQYSGIKPYTSTNAMVIT